MSFVWFENDGGRVKILIYLEKTPLFTHLSVINLSRSLTAGKSILLVLNYNHEKTRRIYTGWVDGHIVHRGHIANGRGAINEKIYAG